MNLEEEIKLEIAQLNLWTKAYDEGNPIISDKEWDYYYFRLQNLENKTGIYFPDSPTQKISYQVVSKLNKVEHNHPMLSLAKTKDMSDFSRYFSGINPSKDVIGMLKLDGLTCSLRYVDGKLVSAETRGNGEIGEDILHNALVIKNIPNKIEYTNELIVDGEVICTYSDFEPFANEYKNPRNFAAGSIRLLDSNECAKRNLTFVVWNVIKGFSEVGSFMYKLQEVEKLGFTVVPYTSSIDMDWAEYLQNKAKELGYPIDGLVGRFDDTYFGEDLGATDHHSRAAFAYKFYDEEYETTLKNIEWTMGRTGVLTPVAVFEPIDIEGTIVERASLHNISVMHETLHGDGWIGQKIKVFKANMIIPQISWAEEWDENSDIPYEILTSPTICPICGAITNVVISTSGVENLICPDSTCDGKLINRIDHFAGKKGLDIKGISKATLEKLIEWGWIEKTEDIFNLKDHRVEWMKKAGFGPKSVDNILDAIEASKITTLEKFITAIGIPLIGGVQAKEICKYAVSYKAFRDMVDSGYNWAKLDGFAEAKTDAIQNFDYTEADAIYAYLTINEDSQRVDSSGNNLEGITFVITGSLTSGKWKNRDALADYITSAGGKVASAVSRRTNYLINNDINSTSSKNESAKKMNIPIITEKEFIEKFLT